MKAVILAAGRGTRMGSYTKNIPKCLLSFARKTLLETQLEVLRGAGVQDISVVGGYYADQLQRFPVTHHTNADYANTNMVYSLFRAEQELRGDILVCYGDIVYEPRVLQTVLQSKADIAVAADEDYFGYWKARFGSLQEDMESFVIDDTDRIQEIGVPDCEVEKAQVRYVGLLKFSRQGIGTVKKMYENNKYALRKAAMTDFLHMLVVAGHSVHAVRVQRGWLEFDRAKDFELYNSWLRQGTLSRFYSGNMP